MNHICKSCGASAPVDSPATSFSCKFCGTKNVDEKYFVEYASRIDSNKANRLLQLGLVAFKSGDYALAEQNIESSLKEDDSNPEAWIYFALCKTHTIKATYFDRSYRSAKEYIAKAWQLDPNADIVVMGKIQVANSFLSLCLPSAKYYFETADKTLFAFGDENGTLNASSEAEKGFEVLKSAFDLDPTDAVLVTSVSVAALAKCCEYDEKLASKEMLIANKEYFLEHALKVYDIREDIVLNELKKYPKYGAVIKQFIDKKRPKANIPETANEPEASKAVSSRLNLRIVKKVAGVIFALVVFNAILSNFNQTSKTESDSKKKLEAPQTAELKIVDASSKKAATSLNNQESSSIMQVEKAHLQNGLAISNNQEPITKKQSSRITESSTLEVIDETGPSGTSSNALQASHCEKEEIALFSCPLIKTNKVVSFCAAPAKGPFKYVEYRYGHPGKVEKTYRAEENGKKLFGDNPALDPRASVDMVWFQEGDYTFSLLNCKGMTCNGGEQDLGLIVMNKGKLISKQFCTGVESQEALSRFPFDFGVNKERLPYFAQRPNTMKPEMIFIDQSVE